MMEGRMTFIENTLRFQIICYLRKILLTSKFLWIAQCIYGSHSQGFVKIQCDNIHRHVPRHLHDKNNSATCMLWDDNGKLCQLT